MSIVNKVGSKPVPSATIESSSDQKSAETVCNQKIETAFQPLTAEGKASKATESSITGEVMRQKLQDSFSIENHNQAADGTRWDFTKSSNFDPSRITQSIFLPIYGYAITS